jgi:hypothetical protein
MILYSLEFIDNPITQRILVSLIGNNQINGKIRDFERKHSVS